MDEFRAIYRKKSDAQPLSFARAARRGSGRLGQGEFAERVERNENLAEFSAQTLQAWFFQTSIDF
jgi:hypothetical protein